LFQLNICCTLVTMATAAILNFFQPPKSCHTLRWIFLQSFMKFDEVEAFGVFTKFKMADVAMVTKVQKL
jgi:hypothetical protein